MELCFSGNDRLRKKLKDSLIVVSYERGGVILPSYFRTYYFRSESWDTPYVHVSWAEYGPIYC